MTVKKDDQHLLVVTGVGGFIGSSIARRLFHDGYRIVGIDDFSTGDRNNVPSGIELVEADLAEVETAKFLPTRAHAVLHLAGQSSGEASFDDPVADLEKNTVSTLRLIDYAIAAQAKRIVYASSMSVYGQTPDSPVSEENSPQPLSCYGASKSSAESYLRIFSHRLPYVSMRMFNVYGPGQDLENLRQGMVSIYLAQALSSRRILVKGSAKRYRDFVYIDDVVEAWVRVLHREGPLNKALNIGTGVRTEVGALLEKIQRLIPDTKVEFIDGTPGDQFGIYANTSRMKKWLEMDSTITLDEGLRRFISQVST